MRKFPIHLAAPLLGTALILIMVMALGGPRAIVVTDGTIHFKQVIDFLTAGGFSLVYESADLDPGRFFIPYGWPYALDAGKDIYLVYPEAFTLYGSLLYGLLGDWGLLLTILLPAAGGLLFVNLILKELGLSGRARFWIGLFHLFGTSFFLFNVNYSEIAAGFLLGNLGLYLYVKHHNTERLVFAVGAGLAFGLAVFFRQESALAFAVLGAVHFAYVKRFRVDRSVVFLAAGFALLVVVFLAYNQFLYGRPFGLRTSSISQEDTGGRWRVMFGLLFTGRVFKAEGGFGYFIQFPFLLLLFVHFRSVWAAISPLPRALLLYGTGTLILIPLLAPNDGWINWGARYLVLTEIAMLGVFFHYRARLRENGTASGLMKAFVAVLIAWSVLFSVPGALQAPASLKGGTLQRSLLENRPEQVFLSATGAHYASGVLIREKKILELQDAADVPRFLDRLRGNKIERFCYVSHSITPYRRSAVDREARDILEHTPGLRRTYEGGDKVIGIRCYALEPGGPGIFGGE